MHEPETNLRVHRDLHTTHPELKPHLSVFGWEEDRLNLGKELVMPRVNTRGGVLSWSTCRKRFIIIDVVSKNTMQEQRTRTRCTRTR